MAIEVTPPFKEFTDLSGAPLDNGYIYIGTENLNPEVNLISIYWDEAFTTPAANPVRTIAGYPSRNGSPGRIFAKSAFSVTVKDKNSQLVYSSLSSNNIMQNTTVGTISALRTTVYSGQSFVSVTGYYTALDNIGVREYYWDATSTEADNGGTIIQVTGVVTGRWKMKYSGAINAKWFGTKGDGIEIDTTAITNAYAYCYASSKKLYIPSGVYKAKLLFNKNVEVYGDGEYETIFTKVDNVYVISVSSSDSLLEGANIHDIGIDGTDGLGVGLVLGGSGVGNQGILYNATIKKIRVLNFETGVYVSAMLSTTCENITSEYCTTYGIQFKNEGPNTTNVFLNCRFRQNTIGMYIGALMVSTFTSCVFESNKDIGIYLRGSTTNTSTSLIFNTCWLENNGHTPTGLNAGLESALYIDFDASVGATYSHNTEFNKCVFSSPVGKKDVYANRAMKVDFNKCNFTDFTIDYLYYVAGFGIGEIYLKDCSKFKTFPTEAMYASFPALSGTQPNLRGFKYSFTDNNGIFFTNNPTLPKVVTLTNVSPATDIIVTGTNTILADTTAGNVTITSMLPSSCRTGQTISIVKYVAANSLILTHSAATGGIIAPSGASITVSNRSVVVMTYNGLQWNLNV